MSNPGMVKVVTEENRILGKIVEADYVLNKSVLSGDLVAKLRERHGARGRIYIDLIDGTDRPHYNELVDGYLCASRTEELYRKALGQSAWFIPHPVDSRIIEGEFSRGAFRIGYLGKESMARHLRQLTSIEVLETGDSLSDRSYKRVSTRVLRWSHHYSIRSYFGDSNFKPPTKVYVAAKSGACFIGSRADEEVRLLLGSDYPYLSQSSELDDAQAVLKFAKDTFQTATWEKASRRMQKVKVECCPTTIARSIFRALEV